MRSNRFTSALAIERLLRIPEYRSPDVFPPPSNSLPPNAESCPASAAAIELLLPKEGGMNDTVDVKRGGRRKATVVAIKQTVKDVSKITLAPRRRVLNTVTRSMESSSSSIII